jgi:hypothetical protein
MRKVDSRGSRHRGRWTIVGRVTKKSEAGLQQNWTPRKLVYSWMGHSKPSLTEKKGDHAEPSATAECMMWIR